MINIPHPETETCGICEVDYPASAMVGRIDNCSSTPVRCCTYCAVRADVSDLPDDAPDTTPRPQLPDFEPLTADLRDRAVETALRAVHAKWERPRLGVYLKTIEVDGRPLLVRVSLGLGRADVVCPAAAERGLRVELRCTDRQFTRLLGLD